VGGGQHYSSPSHSSSSHSTGHSAPNSHVSSWPSRSSGPVYSPMPYSRPAIAPWPAVVDPLLIIALLILAVVLLILLRRIFGASASTQRALREWDGAPRLVIAPAQREAWVHAIRRGDPAFAEGPFLDRLKSLFLATQDAWSSGQLLPVRRFLSDATWLRFRLQLELLRAQGIRNVTADVEVTDMALVGFEQNAWFDTLHVAVQARARDLDVPLAWPADKAQAAAARSSAKAFTEVWSLVRKPGTKSSGDTALAARTCPSCGAPFEGGPVSTCSYCKAVVNSGAYDWVLAEITQATEVTQVYAPPSGLEEMRKRDPGLSLEVLEDRASLVFWRWVEAQSTGQPERLARLAQPGPIERMRADVQHLAEQRTRRVFLECAVGDVRAVAFDESPEGRTCAHIEIRWSARMGIGPLGRSPPPLPVLPQRWVFTLTRANDATSRVDQGMSTDRCPQCGGPLGDGLELKCQWCDTLLAGNLADWTLAEACPFEAWQGRRAPLASEAPRSAVLPGVEERERLLYIMAAMAMADGRVDARERRLLMECAQRWGLPQRDVDTALSAGPGSLDALLPTSDAGEHFLRALAQLARVDGRVDATERRILESVANRLGLAERLPVVLAAAGTN
jgi:uncharacterized tellurite resistance protein B-like protein